MRRTLSPRSLLHALSLAAALIGSGGTGEGARAQVALVLGGGGAAGTAHVGVIAELERQGLRPDCVVGTSMGALVGGLYAAGYGGADLERIAGEIDWDGVLTRSVERANLHPIRKESRLDRFDSQSRLPIGIGEEGPTIAGGLLSDVKLGLILRELTEPVAGIQDFDRLPIPFRAVAADLETGEAVVLGSGDLASALRASMSIPGLFAPVERDGRLLVDGGIADNLPIETGRTLCGAEVVVSFIPPTDPDPRRLRSLTGALGQTLSLFVHRRSREQITSMAPGDVLITPAVESIGMLDFASTGVAVEAGRKAAREAGAGVARLAEGRGPLEPLTPGPRVNLVYDRLVIENESRTDDRVIRARLGLEDAGTIPADELQDRLLRVYGLDVFSSVTYATRVEDGETVLVVRTEGLDTGPLEFRAGLSLRGDSEGQGNLSLLLGASYVGLNSLGARLDFDGAVGATDAARLRLEQPLDFAQTWFLRPSVGFLGQDTLARAPSAGTRGEFRVRQVDAPVELLWVPGDWGRIGLSAGFAAQKVTLETGALGAAERAGLDESWEARPLIGPVLDYDTIDDPDLPLAGEQVAARLLIDPTGPGQGNFGWGQLDLSATAARTVERHTVSAFGILRGEIDPQGLSPSFLGGFQRLSGYDNFGIAGNVAALGGVRYYRRFDMDLPVAQVGFLGGSLEMGGVFPDWSGIGWPGTEIHGSAFAGAVTPLGPLIFAGGLGEGGEFALHLTLGQRF